MALAQFRLSGFLVIVLLNTFLKPFTKRIKDKSAYFFIVTYLELDSAIYFHATFLRSN